MKFKKKVANSSGRPTLAFEWISKVEVKGITFEELADSEGFDVWDGKIACGLLDICHGEFLRQVQLKEEKAAKENKMINGRQIAFMIYEYFKISATEGAILEFSDLLNVVLKGDNLKGFMIDWEFTILGLLDVPDDKILESLFQAQLDHSVQLKDALALYHVDVTQNGKEKSYEKLQSIVRIHLEDRQRKKVRDQSQKHQKAFPAGKPKAKGSPKKKKGDCYTFAERGSCPRGKDCPFLHDQETSNERKGRPREKTPEGKGKGKGKSKSQSRESSPKGKGKGKGKSSGSRSNSVLRES
jgi:hypothetical protein